MGNHLSSKFLGALRSGNVEEASRLYEGKVQLRESLQPNSPLGSDHDENNTYLHYAALLGIHKMYGDLIRLNGGKPDMKNAQRRNCLHLICLCKTGGPLSAEDDIRHNMIELTMEEGLKGMDLKHLLAERDVDGNTALHLAAGAGLKRCVELLVRYEADMVATNEDGQTPADLAKARFHNQIATHLEAKMVFSNEEDMAEVVEPDSDLLEEIVEAPVVMQDTDLRSMKDTLLIETSQILGVCLQSAETLLKHYGWSKENLLEAWVDDSEAVCAEVGVDMPRDHISQDFLDVVTSPSLEVGMNENEDIATECSICYVPCECLPVPCGHQFCRDCWRGYLEGKIEMGDSQSISCPQYACYKLVPLEVIEGVVSKKMAAKFLSFDIKAFVDTNPNIRWCPYPGCSQAVNRPPPPPSEDSPNQSSEVRGQTVPCGNGHFFCWTCREGAHEPCNCSQWKRWLDHCNEMSAKIGETTAAEVDEAASSKWLVENSKPCPKCRAPIEKTEGCNHMCCKFCRHDFCWVCLEEWKCHNSSTGGYFNCNRYDAQLQAGHLLAERRDGVLKDYKGWEEMSRFLHYHERYREHMKSYDLEVPFLDGAQQKMVELAASIQCLESGSDSSAQVIAGSRQLDLSFIHDAVQELLKCRQVLKATYCFGYYLTGIISKKQFEHMQGALEQVTEMLAEAVARPHLRKPRLEIIRLTREARVKRVCLVKNVHSGLPLSTHPFMDSLHPFGGSGTKNDPHLRRFLRDLDTYIPREEQLAVGRSRRHKPDTDEEFLRILEESRLEFEADKRMQQDLELASNLSLHHPQPESPSPMNGGPAPSWPVLKLESPATLPELKDETRMPSLEDCKNSPDEWGPIHGEDEDLRIALHDSLMLDKKSTDVATIGVARAQSSGDKWGPMHNEDEDMRIALQNSLKLDKNGKAGATNNGHASGATQAKGHERKCRFPQSFEHELAGLECDPTTPLLQNYASQHSFSHQPQTHNIRPEERTALPPQLQQLLDSSERLGTNV